MGWFKKILGIVGTEAPKDFIFVPSIDRAASPEIPIVPDDAYIELFVESLRLDKARSFATRFHGVVYSFASLAKLGETAAVFASVSKPDKLAELDKESIGKVITVSRKMLGPVPWRGGQLALQLGLFSVKSGNVLTPLLDFVTKVSDAAGIAFVGAVKPFVPLISEGMDLIAGQAEDTRLVVGIDTALALPTTAICAIIAKPKNSIDTSKLAVAVDGKLEIAGVPLDAAYCVFSIRATDRKPDFGEIPALKSSFAVMRDAIVKGDEEEAREAFGTFKRTALTSPDLIRRDAVRLVALAEQTLNDAFPPISPAVKTRGGRKKIVKKIDLMSVPASLGMLALYKD